MANVVYSLPLIQSSRDQSLEWLHKTPYTLIQNIAAMPVDLFWLQL